MKLPLHDRFIEQAIEYVSQDQRLIGLLAGGSKLYGEMDEYSDLDLVIVYNGAFRSEVMQQRLRIAERFGNLLSAFFDELWLLVHPVMASHGERLFALAAKQQSLRLSRTKTYKNGVVG